MADDLTSREMWELEHGADPPFRVDRYTSGWQAGETRVFRWSDGRARKFTRPSNTTLWREVLLLLAVLFLAGCSTTPPAPQPCQSAPVRCWRVQLDQLTGKSMRVCADPDSDAQPAVVPSEVLP